MKRVALRRRTPMPRGKSLSRGKTELRRRTRLAAVTRDATKRAARHRLQYGPAGYADWLRSLGCVVPGCQDERIEVAHVRSRAAGGDWQDCVPLCRDHHASQHALGVRTFERRHRLDLADLAAAHVLRWRQFAGNGSLDLAHPFGSQELAAERGVVAHPRGQDQPQALSDVLHSVHLR